MLVFLSNDVLEVVVCGLVTF